MTDSAAIAPVCLLVHTTLPDLAQAERLAGLLVERGLVACASIQSPCRSLYRWQGQVESSEEIPLLLKTTAAAYPALAEVLRAEHPYELPEIIAVPVTHGLPDYLAWVAANVGAP
jgi:periplasmic divalent cation tolerance protein